MTTCDLKFYRKIKKDCLKFGFDFAEHDRFELCLGDGDWVYFDYLKDLGNFLDGYKHAKGLK